MSIRLIGNNNCHNLFACNAHSRYDASGIILVGYLMVDNYLITPYQQATQMAIAHLLNLPVTFCDNFVEFGDLRITLGHNFVEFGDLRITLGHNFVEFGDLRISL